MIDHGVNPAETNWNGPQMDHRPSDQTTSTNWQQFACLYTKHKTQKHKKWSDGRLVVDKYSCRLHDADPQLGAGDPMIDSCSLSGSEYASILSGKRTDLETEKLLIMIDGPWKPPTNVILSSQATASRGMSKLLQTKFRKPKRMGPPPPLTSSTNPVLTKRQRPLQPGELHNRYYGSNRTEATPPQPSHQQRQEPQQSNERTSEFVPPAHAFNASSFYEEDETVTTHGAVPRPVATLERQDDHGANEPMQPSTETDTQSQIQASWFLSPQSSQTTLDAPRQNRQMLCSHHPQNPSLPAAQSFDKETSGDAPWNDPQVFSVRPPSTDNTYLEKEPPQGFAETNDYQASQYYGDEGNVDEEENPATSPQAFSVPVSYRSVRQEEKASRAELLDLFSENPLTTDEYLLPDGSSSDES